MRLIVRRILLWLLSLLILSVAIFIAMRLLPSDTARVMAGLNATDEQVRLLRERLGLNKPWIIQYGLWLSHVLRGDLGVSAIAGKSVSTLLLQRLSITFPIMVLSLLFAVTIGIPLGIYAVCARSRSVQSLLRIGSLTAASIPALWLALLLLALGGRSIGVFSLFPTQGFTPLGWADAGHALAAIIVPSFTVGIIVAASFMRYTASCLRSIAYSPVIEYAQACGLTRTESLVRVGMRLILPQLVSVIGLTFAHLATGVLVVENLFALPGIGFGLITDVGTRDVVAVQSELLVLAVFFLTLGFIVDMLHRWFDPRLRVIGNV